MVVVHLDRIRHKLWQRAVVVKLLVRLSHLVDSFA